VSEPFIPVGFDYATAVLHLRDKMTYERMAEFCGYENKSTIFRIANGRVPNHPQGEALWALYLHIFGVKPPMRPDQTVGAPIEIAEWQRKEASTAV
jgi:hypothetical protein